MSRKCHRGRNTSMPDLVSDGPHTSPAGESSGRAPSGRGPGIIPMPQEMPAVRGAKHPPHIGRAFIKPSRSRGREALRPDGALGRPAVQSWRVKTGMKRTWAVKKTWGSRPGDGSPRLLWCVAKRIGILPGGNLSALPPEGFPWRRSQSRTARAAEFPIPRTAHPVY